MSLFPGELSVLNLGIAGFADAIRSRGGAATQLDWAPPAAGDRAAGEALARLINEPKIEAANAQAVERYLAAQPKVTFHAAHEVFTPAAVVLTATPAGARV